MVGLELEIVSRKLDRFGWEGMNDYVRERLLADWMDALADFTIIEIRKAISTILPDTPKDAMNEQKVRAQVQQHRGVRLKAIPAPREPERPPPDPAMKARINAVVQQAFGGRQNNNTRTTETGD